MFPGHDNPHVSPVLKIPEAPYARFLRRSDVGLLADIVYTVDQRVSYYMK
jgi:hypothetical protein